MEDRYFNEKVVEWYKLNKRELPWRETQDPYKIWLSEIILQQTRVNQGLPYYLRFIQKFPNVFALAAATEEEVLRLWQGLGYYTRARNLHKCAKVVVETLAGDFPVQFQKLILLPGVGSYTAAAIASFSNRERVAVVDGNVFRVLARVFGVEAEINSPSGRKIFQDLANRLIHQQQPDVYNQAIMEFGALWCTPHNPQCGQCVFRESCFAFVHNLQALLPVKLKSKKTVKRYFYYFVVKKGKSLLMKKRQSGDIWQGLYDFYLVETPNALLPADIIKENPFLKKMASKNRGMETTKEYKHVLSHQTIISKFILMEESANTSIVSEEPLKYYSRKKIQELPKPVLISRFLTDYNFL